MTCSHSGWSEHQVAQNSLVCHVVKIVFFVCVVELAHFQTHRAHIWVSMKSPSPLNHHWTHIKIINPLSLSPLSHWGTRNSSKLAVGRWSLTWSSTTPARALGAWATGIAWRRWQWVTGRKGMHWQHLATWIPGGYLWFKDKNYKYMGIQRFLYD